MRHDPVDVAHAVSEAALEADPDRRLDILLAALPPCPSLPGSEEEIAASDARAMADFAAGRYHSAAVVRTWAETASVHGLGFREWIAARDG